MRDAATRFTWAHQTLEEARKDPSLWRGRGCANSLVAGPWPLPGNKFINLHHQLVVTCLRFLRKLIQCLNGVGCCRGKFFREDLIFLCLTSETLTALCSDDLSKEKSWKIDIVSPSRAKGSYGGCPL